MNLTGIEIFAGGKLRFIGKVGVCPNSCERQELRGRIIFYREENYKSVYSHETKSYGIDRAAFDMACRKWNVIAHVLFLKDRNELLITPAGMVTSSPVVDLGEAPQYRIPEKNIFRHYTANKIKMGYTTNIEHIRADGSPLILEKKPEATQGKLF